MEFTHAQARVVEQLRTQRVASWTQLARRLRCSTKTVQRALAKVGYFNSINHNGGFVTLRSVPQFDRHGLWTHDTVHFSRHGNLLDTLKRLVEQAPGGRTMQELEQLVGTRVHNHVSRLVREGKLGPVLPGPPGGLCGRRCPAAGSPAARPPSGRSPAGAGARPERRASRPGRHTGHSGAGVAVGEARGRRGVGGAGPASPRRGRAPSKCGRFSTSTG